MTSRTFIGVDPGQGGAVAWSNRLGEFVEPMPDSRGGVIALIRRIKSECFDHEQDHIIAYMEKISGFIPDGGASMMFQFGANVERIGCILACHDIRTVELVPRTWQKELGLGNSDRVPMNKDMTPAQRKAAKDWNAGAKREWKNKLKSEAERRFPKLKVTLKTCDALLLLDVAIMREKGGLGI